MSSFIILCCPGYSTSTELWFSYKIFFFNFLLFGMYILSSIYTILSCFHDNPLFFFSAWTTSCSLVLFFLIFSSISNLSVVIVPFNMVTSTVVFLVHNSSLSNQTSLLFFFVFTWSFLDKMSAFVFIFPGICCKVKL